MPIVRFFATDSVGGGEPRNLDWSTFVGGSAGDELECVEVDEVGDPYACGYTWFSSFPVAPGTEIFPPFIGQGPGSLNAVVLKYRAIDKRPYWATYYGGSDGGVWSARTKAHKLAVYDGESNEHQYAFVTGSTNCLDFEAVAHPASPFSNAVAEAYSGGVTRMWLGAFRKLDGLRRWSTTHGQSEERTWSEHGLAIDVDPTGQVVVGGQLESFGNSNVVTPNFPLATPSGAWSRAVGGGFFIVFNGQYQIDWATTFGEFTPADAFTKITDLRLGKDDKTGRKVLWLVGTSSSGTNDPLDVVEISDAFFQPTSSGPSAMIARVDLDGQNQIGYCTRWGNSVAEAYGLELTGKSLWVVGYTVDTELTSEQCPNPGGTGVHHTATHAGTAYGQASDGFILRFVLTPFDLNYGTLIGGTRDDILLDVTGFNDSQVFITGETRSNSGFADDINSNYYFQSEYDFWNRRDAVILSISDQPVPAMLWRTAFGGTMSDRGWGIAASNTEVYLVGATASQFSDAFPLWDFDPGSNLDYYQEVNMGGSTSAGMVPFYQFCFAMDHEFVPGAPTESLNTPHDGFIASFGNQTAVGVFEHAFPAPSETGLIATPLPGGAVWMVTAPYTGAWDLRVVDAVGRQVRAYPRQTQPVRVDLEGQAPGLYVLQGSGANGQTHTLKISKP